MPVPTGTQIVGAPQLTFTYSGLGTGRTLYAQIVDDKTGRVLGNLVTPIPVTLDGQSHTVTVELGTLNEHCVHRGVAGQHADRPAGQHGHAVREPDVVRRDHVSNMTLSLPTVAAGVDAPVDV